MDLSDNSISDRESLTGLPITILTINSKAMQTTYAKTTEDVMNYFRENYGIEMVIHNSSVCDRRVYLNDGRRADFGTRDCACGESYGCTLYDLDDNEEEEFIICESCYKDADYRI